MAWAIACQTGDDDDNGESDDDDDDNDDNDNDNDDDDDVSPYTCAQVGDGLVFNCPRDLPLPQGIDQSWEEWCELSEALFTAKLQAPAWNCLGDHVFITECEEAAYDACWEPPDPGGTGCDHTVDAIYGCDIVFAYDYVEPEKYYYIPEMDMMAACSSVMSDHPWDCYRECVESEDCDTLLDCLNACLS